MLFISKFFYQRSENYNQLIIFCNGQSNALFQLAAGVAAFDRRLNREKFRCRTFLAAVFWQVDRENKTYQKATEENKADDQAQGE